MLPAAITQKYMVEYMTKFDVPLVLGMMRLQEHEALCKPAGLVDWLYRRLEQGLHWIDHADIYGDRQCELLFGKALAQAPELKSKLKLISKADIVTADRDPSCWQVKHYNSSGHYLRSSVEGSLKRLGVEQLGLFLLHRPDPLMLVEETADTLKALVDEGKVAGVGVSNHLPEQWRLLNDALGDRLVCNQIELSLRHTAPLFEGQNEAHQRDGLQVMAWSPLGGGAFDNPVLATLMADMSQRYDCSETALAIAWLARIPGNPLPVLGSFNEQRIADALVGAELKLARSDWFALLEAARGYKVA